MVFKTISSKTVFIGRVFDVRQDQFFLPNGRQARIDLVVHRGAVTIVPVDEIGMIWFIRQYRHPASKVLLELPAGVLEDGELPEVGADRELQEEIGMSAVQLKQLGGFFLAPGYSTEYLTIFLATGLVTNPLEPDEDEMIEIAKLPIDEALAMAETGLIEDAKTLAALLLARPYIVNL